MVLKMKVLVAVDSSERSMQTLRTVGFTDWPSGTTIRLVFAVPQAVPAPAPTLTGVSVGFEEFTGTLKNEAQAQLDRAAKTLEREGLTTETVVRTGSPRAVIVEEARQWSADLIVLGSPVEKGLKRWLSGRVAEYVVAHAPCSVEVVRPKAAA